jgi:transketolase
LVAIVDRNYLCATDFTEEMLALEPIDEKWRSFGWNVVNINGHSFEEIFEALNGFRSRKSTKPLVIIADTTKGKGVEFLCNDPLWHSLAPKGEQAKKAKEELNDK